MLNSGLFSELIQEQFGYEKSASAQYNYVSLLQTVNYDFDSFFKQKDFDKIFPKLPDGFMDMLKSFSNDVDIAISHFQKGEKKEAFSALSKSFEDLSDVMANMESAQYVFWKEHPLNKMSSGMVSAFVSLAPALISGIAANVLTSSREALMVAAPVYAIMLPFVYKLYKNMGAGNSHVNLNALNNLSNLLRSEPNQEQTL